MRTKSESASAEDNFERTPHKSTPGLTKQDATEIKSEDENEEENYDEFDVLTDIHTDSRRSRNLSGGGAGTGSNNPGYLRSLSEGVPQAGIGTYTTTGSNCSHTCSDEEVNQRTIKKIIIAAKQRRQIHGKRKDYTSITDELELMIASSPPLDLPNIDQPLTPQPNMPAIQIETECLHDAEEADYELMETIIDNRLRRDSTNLQASFEDLAIRSIIEGFQIESEPESLELERQKHQKKDEIILNQEF